MISTPFQVVSLHQSPSSHLNLPHTLVVMLKGWEGRLQVVLISFERAGITNVVLRKCVKVVLALWVLYV